MKTKKRRMKSLRVKSQEVEITLQNKFAHLNEQNEVSVDNLNGNLTWALSESAAAVGEAACRDQIGKLTKTKQLIANVRT